MLETLECSALALSRQNDFGFLYMISNLKLYEARGHISFGAYVDASQQSLILKGAWTMKLVDMSMPTPSFLLLLCNAMFRTGHLPDCLNTTLLTPI